MRGGCLLIAVLLSASMLAASSGPSAANRIAELRAAHAPILIDGDWAFTSQNGVTAGQGTPTSPFLIANWSILVTRGAGIEVRNTSVPFVIRNVSVKGASSDPLVDTFGVRLANVSAGRLEGFDLRNVTTGIVLEATRGLTVDGGSINLEPGTTSVFGLVDSFSRNLSISHVDFTRVTLAGMDLVEGANVSVTQNWFNPGSGVGIQAGEVTDFRIEENMFLSYSLGLGMLNSSRVSVARNSFREESVGILLTVSHNVTLEENLFVLTQAAVQFQHDARFPSLVNDGVSAFHNNFVNSSINMLAPALGLTWDQGYPSGGNFWTAYRGPDRCRGPSQSDCSNRDGIGDVPFLVNATPAPSGFTDHYPLIRPYPLPTEPPTARLSISSTTGDVGTAFSFDASASSDPSDSTAALEFRWDWNGDGAWDTEWSGEPTARHQYASSSIYSVHLQVRNTSGLMNETTARVSVAPLSPWALATVVLAGGGITAAFVILYLRRRTRR